MHLDVSQCRMIDVTEKGGPQPKLEREGRINPERGYKENLMNFRCQTASNLIRPSSKGRRKQKHKQARAARIIHDTLNREKVGKDPAASTHQCRPNGNPDSGLHCT